MKSVQRKGIREGGKINCNGKNKETETSLKKQDIIVSTPHF